MYAPLLPLFLCASVSVHCVCLSPQVPGAVGTVCRLVYGLRLSEEICLWLTSTLVVLPLPLPLPSPSLDEQSSFCWSSVPVLFGVLSLQSDSFVQTLNKDKGPLTLRATSCEQDHTISGFRFPSHFVLSYLEPRLACRDGLRPFTRRQHHFGQGVCCSPPRTRFLSSAHRKFDDDHRPFRLNPHKFLALPRRPPSSPISPVISLCNLSATRIRDTEFPPNVRVASFHIVSMATDLHTKAAPLAVHSNSYWYPCVVFPLRRTLVLLHLQP
jgi:hypothetical protein